MLWPIVVAWLHYVGIMLLMAGLLGEHLVLKPELTAAQARTLATIDSIFGMSAGLVLVTGVARVFLEKGANYYLHNAAFHLLVGVFILVGLISIYPTVIFLRWRKPARAGQPPHLAPGQFKRIQMIVRTEMALLLLAPLFATGMAHGWLMIGR